MLNMVNLLSDNFLPDVEACDEEGFVDCLMISDQGWDFNQNDFNSDIFTHACAPPYGCQIKNDVDEAASELDGQLFEGNATALM
jgi:hypothetical protein